MRLQKYGSSTLACSAHFLKYRLMRRCAPPSQNKKTDLKSIKILSLKKALPTGFDTEPFIVVIYVMNVWRRNHQ